MPLFYSAARAGFFDSAIHVDLPADAVELTREQHAALLAGQSEGKRICADRRGHPCLRDPDAKPLEERRAAAVRRARDDAMSRILAIASPACQSNDNADIAVAALQIAQAGATTIDTAPALQRRTRINAVRAACIQLEAAIAAMSAHAIAALDTSSPSHWPN